MSLRPKLCRGSQSGSIGDPFDLEKSKSLLEAAGYVDADGDGIRATSDGQPLNLGLCEIVDYPPRMTMAQCIGQWLDEVGIEVQVEAQEAGTWYQVVLGDCDSDMAMGFEPPDVDPASLDH